MTTPNTQIVSQSLTLQCKVITVRGIISRADIVWRRYDTIVNTTRLTATTTTKSNLVVYRDFYIISQLSTFDDGANYECRLIIYSSPVIQVDDNVRLDLTGE